MNLPFLKRAHGALLHYPCLKAWRPYCVFALLLSLPLRADPVAPNT